MGEVLVKRKDCRGWREGGRRPIRNHGCGRGEDCDGLVDYDSGKDEGSEAAGLTGVGLSYSICYINTMSGIQDKM